MSTITPPSALGPSPSNPSLSHNILPSGSQLELLDSSSRVKGSSTQCMPPLQTRTCSSGSLGDASTIHEGSEKRAGKSVPCDITHRLRMLGMSSPPPLTEVISSRAGQRAQESAWQASQEADASDEFVHTGVLISLLVCIKYGPHSCKLSPVMIQFSPGQVVQHEHVPVHPYNLTNTAWPCRRHAEGSWPARDCL